MKKISHRGRVTSSALRRACLSLVVILGFLVSSCNQGDSFYEELAFHYAPVHYQVTSDTNYKADLITRVDYDSNWTSTDNWENLYSGDLSAWVYYSVVESCTHWFIVYAFFHPRDWSDNKDVDDEEHENDMEGLLAVVRKGGSEFGQLLGIITVAHLDFFSYTPKGSPLTDGEEDIDGELSWQIVDGSPHPKTIQETQGHPLKAWPFVSDFPGNDNQHVIIYFPSRTTSMIPQSGNDHNVSYRLIDLTAAANPNLWFFQLLDADPKLGREITFATWGTLKGDKHGSCGHSGFRCASDRAHAPWGWDDHDDGPTFVGEMALSPAHLVDRYFDGLGDLRDKYLHNKYLEDLRDQGYGPDFLPRGWPAELNLAELYSKLTTTCP